jgi:UDP-N-acetylmuramate--alanine ligase
MPDFAQLERDFATACALLTRGSAAVHFAGIGGVGMAGLAHLLSSRGFTVSGCDSTSGRVTDWLQQHGVSVQLGHDATHITKELAWLVRTPAIAADAPEILAAQARGLPVLARGVVLPALLKHFSFSIAIAGTHGKTTTTAMAAQLLQAAGLAPAFAIGGEVEALGGVAGTGAGQCVVVEADESDGTLALYAPDIAVVTNIEFDHMEHFGGEPELVECFQRFIRQARRVVFCADDPRAAALCAGGISYGFADSADFRATHVELTAFTSNFDLLCHGETMARLRLPVPGRHNIQNALAACAVAHAVFQGLETGMAGFPKVEKKEGPVFPRLGKNHAESSKPWKNPLEIFQALEKFCPARRRFEVVSEAGGVLVISDYAHHPTEVRALVAAARGLGRRLVAVFQPHRYTRTLALGADFPAAFSGVAEVVLAPVYAASEAPLEGGTSRALARHFAQSGVTHLREVESLEAAWFYLREILRDGDVLLVVGAGDVEKIAFWAKDFYGKKV